MSSIIAAINMTIDGICDHTVGIVDEQLHMHYADLLRDARCLLYGRTTYELMLFWRDLIAQPSGEESMDHFARVMDAAPKIVFSRTLRDTDWHSASLAQDRLETVVQQLKSSEGAPVYVGSPSLIASLSAANLIDEYQLCIHPVLAGKGLRLLPERDTLARLYLRATKVFDSGCVVLYYTATQTSGQ